MVAHGEVKYMIKKYGRDLFLPEGDDYSKTEFNQHQEEMLADGQAVLQQLRMEQMVAQQSCMAAGCRAESKASSSNSPSNVSHKVRANPEEKLSYKELLEKAVARK